MTDRLPMALAVTGVLLLIVSVVSFFESREAVLVGGFLVAGTSLILVGSFSSRLEGRQEVSLSGLSLNLSATRALVESERHLQDADVTEFSLESSADGEFRLQVARDDGSPSTSAVSDSGIVFSPGAMGEVERLGDLERDALTALFGVLQRHGRIPGEASLQVGERPYRYFRFADDLAVFFRRIDDGEVEGTSPGWFINTIGSLGRDPRFVSLGLATREHE